MASEKVLIMLNPKTNETIVVQVHPTSYETMLDNYQRKGYKALPDCGVPKEKLAEIMKSHKLPKPEPEVSTVPKSELPLGPAETVPETPTAKKTRKRKISEG